MKLKKICYHRRFNWCLYRMFILWSYESIREAKLVKCNLGKSRWVYSCTTSYIMKSLYLYHTIQIRLYFNSSQREYEHHKLTGSEAVHRRFRGTYCLHFLGSKNETSKKPLRWEQKWHFAACVLTGTLFPFSSIPKMEAVRSSETSLRYYWITQRQNTVFLKLTKV
jgi:hypothetical protein